MSGRIRILTVIGTAGVLAIGLLGPVPASQAASTPPNVGVTEVYPTIFATPLGTSLTVTVINPQNYLTSDTTATFSVCSAGVSPSATPGPVVLSPSSSTSQNGSQAQVIGVFSIPSPTFASGTTSGSCNLTLTNSTGQGNIGDSTLVGDTVFSFSATAPQIGLISPTSGPAVPTSSPVIKLTGTNLPAATYFNGTSTAMPSPMSLPAATSTFLTNCVVNENAYGVPVVPATGLFVPAAAANGQGGFLDYSTISGNTITTILSNGIEASTCDLIVPIPSSDNNNGGLDYLAVLGGYTWEPPYQGPIAITVTNPVDGDSNSRSGISDADLWISLVGTPGAPATSTQGCATAGAWAGSSTSATSIPINGSSLSSVSFTTLSDY
ncbi:MAG: hypothetical protein NTX29_04100, partial [Actinobacteria bacterium]|nr:hypothetical protein [Actinomycetota bacterium]